MGYSSWGLKESDMIEGWSTPTCTLEEATGKESETA